MHEIITDDCLDGLAIPFGSTININADRIHVSNSISADFGNGIIVALWRRCMKQIKLLDFIVSILQ